MSNFRKLTEAELQSYGIKSNPQQKKFLDLVKKNFGDKVAKIMVGCSTEYNDEYHQLHGLSYVEVYDAKGELMTPLKSQIAEWRRVLTSGSTYGLFDSQKDEDSDDFVDEPNDIVINIGNTDLYVKE